MRVCPNCGEHNAGQMKFCGQCGTSLANSATRQEERKVVTVLFADLVGFTSRSEAMDVEDVRGAPALPQAPAPRVGAVRRDGREVHLRRGHGLVLRSHGA